MSSKVVNLAGKTLVVDDIKLLRGSKKTSRGGNVSVSAQTAITGKEAEEASKTLLNSVFKLSAWNSAMTVPVTMIERNTKKEGSQIVVFKAEVSGYANPNPIIAVSELPRVCASVNSAFTYATLIEDYPVGSEFSTQSLGGWKINNFSVGELAVVIFNTSDSKILSLVCTVTAVGEYLTLEVGAQLDYIFGLDNRNSIQAIAYIPYRNTEPIVAYLYDGAILKDSIEFSINDTSNGATYIGVVDSDNFDELTSNVSEGDFILVNEDFDEFLTGYPYMYRDGDWIIQETITSENSAMFMAMANDAESIGALNNGPFNGFVNMVASTAVINQLFSENITMTGQGVIQSESAVDDTSQEFLNEVGYRLNANNGVLQAKGAYINDLNSKNANIENSTISGKFKSNALETFDGIPSIASSDIRSPYDTQWNNVQSQNLSSDVSLIDNSKTSGVICYGGGFYLWCLSGYDGVFISQDGKNWTKNKPSSLPEYFEPTAVSYGNGKFILAGWDVDADDCDTEKIYAITVNSVSSISVTRYTLPVQSYWTYSCYENGKFIIVGRSSNYILPSVFPLLANKIVYSTNGTTWYESTLDSVGQNIKFSCVCYGNGKYIAVGNNGLSASLDGITWTSAQSSSYFDYVAFGNNKFVAFNESRIYYSDNGTDWTQTSTTTGGYYSAGITYNSTLGLFVIGMYSKIFYSKNGTDWFRYTKAGVYFCNTYSMSICSSAEGVLLLTDGSGTAQGLYEVTVAYNLSNIISFFTSVLPKTSDTWRESLSETTPFESLVEPLQSLTQASGNFHFNGEDYTISKIQITSSRIVVQTASETKPFDSSELSNDMPSITNLVIFGEDERVEVGDIIPKNPLTSNIGTLDKPVNEGWFTNLYKNGVQVVSSSYTITPSGSEYYIEFSNGLKVILGDFANASSSSTVTYNFLDGDFFKTRLLHVSMTNGSVSTSANYGRHAGCTWTESVLTGFKYVTNTTSSFISRFHFIAIGE